MEGAGQVEGTGRTRGAPGGLAHGRAMATLRRLREVPRHLLVCEKSNFGHDKSRHRHLVETHYHNYRVSPAVWALELERLGRAVLRRGRSPRRGCWEVLSFNRSEPVVCGGAGLQLPGRAGRGAVCTWPGPNAAGGLFPSLPRPRCSAVRLGEGRRR